MSIISKALHHTVDFVVVRSVSHNLSSKELILVNTWKFSKDKEESYFKKSAFLSQDFNWVSSIL